MVRPRRSPPTVFAPTAAMTELGNAGKQEVGCSAALGERQLLMS